MAQHPYSDVGLIIAEVSRIHLDKPHSVGILWTRDRPVAEISIW